MNVSLPPCSTEDLEKPSLDSLAFKGPRPPLHGAGNRDPQENDRKDLQETHGSHSSAGVPDP